MKTLLLLLILSCPIWGQKLTVQISATGNNPANIELRSYVARGLRSLGDVEVVEKRGAFIVVLTPYDDLESYDVTFQLVKPATCKGQPYLDLIVAGLHSGTELKRISDQIVISVDNALNTHRTKR